MYRSLPARAPRASSPCAANCSRQSSSGLSSETAVCLPRTTSGAAGCKSHDASRKLPRAVAAGPSHWNSDARPKRSRSMAYGWCAMSIADGASAGGSSSQLRRTRAAPRAATTRSASCQATRSSTRACQATSAPKTRNKPASRANHDGLRPRTSVQISTAKATRKIERRAREILIDRPTSTSRRAWCSAARC